MKKNYLFTWLICWLAFPAFASRIAQKVYQYQADKSALERRYSNHFTDEYFQRMTLFYTDWQKQCNEIPFSTLSPEEKIDYLLLKNHLAKTTYFHQEAHNQYKEVFDVTDFATPIYAFTIARRDAQKPNSPALSAAFFAANNATKAKIAALKSRGPYTSWQQAERAAEVVKGLAEAVKNAYEFYAGYDPEFSWWMPQPYKELLASLTEYEKFLRGHYVNTVVKDDGSGIIGKPIGKKAIEKELSYEMIPYSPEQLIAEAEKQYAWCEREMIKASQELGFGTNWRAALEKVKQTYLPAGEWPQEVHRFAVEAIDFIEKRDLVTVPPLAKETWRMTMMSAEAQKVSPFFLGGEVIQIAYPTIDMAHDDKMMSMRGNNPHFSHATVQHELIPGHHLQQFMNQRYQPHRRLFSTPFWTEGWALYWEFNLWDKNFTRSPEDKIGMLFWRMHRCARIVFSLNYHLEKMTPQQCIDYLVEKVGHERANAEAEVRRSFTGRYGPLYQIAYMIGGLQFYSLKKELVDKGKMSEKQFHDTILQNNSIPVEMVRAILTNQSLSPDMTSTWKFLSN